LAALASLAREMERAERLRPIPDELAGMSARATADDI
jgi:hypothetical protein